MSELTALDKVKIGIELETSINPIRYGMCDSGSGPTGKVTRTSGQIYNVFTKANQSYYDFERFVTDNIKKIGKDVLYAERPVGRDGGGPEIRFKPMTFEELKNNFSVIKEMLAFLEEAGYSKFDSNTAGIHVHIDRSFFSLASFLRISRFLHKSHFFLQTFTNRRTRADYTCYVDKVTGGGHTEETFQESGVACSGLRMNQHGVNKTIEFRIFNSVLCPFRFASFFEFCLFLGMIARTHDISDFAVSECLNANPELLAMFPNLTRETVRYGLVTERIPTLQTA